MADRHRISIGIADVVIQLSSPLSADALGLHPRLSSFLDSVHNSTFSEEP